MKTYFGNYLGIVIDNNDPEHRGRVQVFIPHIMPTLYEGWNKKGENITLKCVADNVPEGLSSEIVERLKKILPWAEAASPIIGQSGPGSAGAGLAGAMAAAGASPLGAIAGDVASNGASNGGSVEGNQATTGVNLDQSPTSSPAGALVPGEPFLIPKAHSGVDVSGLRPIYVQRVNAFYKEAVTLGYKIQCTSAYRSYAKQADLFRRIGRPGCAPPGNSTHETGLAIDLYITGPGVSITSLSVASSRSGKNYDTPEFRALLRKYNLHQPLHPLTGATGPEHWHVEPIEMPAAFKGDRSGAQSLKIAQLMSAPSQNAVSETTSSSQFAAAPSPHTSAQGNSGNMAPATTPLTT